MKKALVVIVILAVVGFIVLNIIGRNIAPKPVPTTGDYPPADVSPVPQPAGDYPPACYESDGVTPCKG